MTISQVDPNRLRPGEGDDPGPIVLVDETRREEAVRRLVGGDPSGDPDHPRRFLEFAERQAIDLRAMWSRLDGQGRMTATVLTVPSPGRTAMVFATRPRREEEIPSLGQLIEHACRQLPTLAPPHGEVDLAQVLVDPAEHLERQAYLAGGFRRLAYLSYLERALPGARVAAPDWPADVHVEPYDESRREELLAVLEASYENTLDCPGLLGLRRTADILEGHRATGEFDPALWCLLMVDGRPAGALLLNPSSQGRCIELVYLGLARPARGRGLGGRLLEHGLRLLRGRSERVIMLAVDEENAPAMRLYRAAGFRRMLRRVALIRPLRA